MPELVGLDPVRRSFARQFIALRGRARLTQEQAAKALEVGRATVTRIEDAQDGVKLTAMLVGAMADLFQAEPQERQLLLALAAETRNGRQKSWFQDYTSTELPTWFTPYLALEELADKIRIYSAELVPGLLQTERYARTVISMPPDHVAADEVEARTQARIKRQLLLASETPPRLEAITSEAVLRRVVGGPDVMREQLERLLDLTEPGNVSFRVVPFDAGAHAGLAASDFTLLDFRNDHSPAEIVEPPLVYFESLTGAMYGQKPTEVLPYRTVWTHLEKSALSEKGTRALLQARRKELKPA